MAIKNEGLNSAETITTALIDAGSWAALSRTSGIAESTLKSRGNRLGVKLDESRAGQLSTEDVEAWLDDDEDEDRPILSEEDFKACQDFVERNVHYLLHSAPAAISAAMNSEEGCSFEQAEEILVARINQRLVELVYSTHGVSRQMLWWVEAQEKERERANQLTAN